MVAATSCPMTRGKVTSGFLPRKVFRSVPHRPIILICSKVSPEPLEGSGMSARVALPGSCTTTAFMLVSLFQIVGSGGCCTEDVCALVVAEVCEIVSEDLPPLGISAGYEAYGPIGAGHKAIGAKCAHYSVQIGSQRFDRPVCPGVLRHHA